MQFTISHKIESWGHSLLIKNKIASGYLYWYNDDPLTIYLAGLKVKSKYRERGIATQLQKMRESMGLILGGEFFCLRVKKHSWMYEWYKRRGYIDWVEKKNYIWMRKTL
jgi:hypothetical protein